MILCIPLFFLLTVSLSIGKIEKLLDLPSVDGTSAKASEVAIGGYGPVKRAPNSKGHIIDTCEAMTAVCHGIYILLVRYGLVLLGCMGLEAVHLGISQIIPIAMQAYRVTLTPIQLSPPLVSLRSSSIDVTYAVE